MHLMFLLGIDSVDSSSWRTKAAFGAIQIAGVGDRYVTRVKRHFVARQLSDTERNVLNGCRCPPCKRQGFPALTTSFRSRAIHNAWILQAEVRKARRLMKAGKYNRYAQELLRGSRYGPADRAESCNEGHVSQLAPLKSSRYESANIVARISNERQSFNGVVWNPSHGISPSVS